MRQQLPAAALTMLLLSAGSTVLATPGARADAEIRHLIDFVAASGCSFVRNGDPHEPKAAAEHLLMKYGKAKSRVDTAEDFIDKVASRSYLTGNPYSVRCPGKPEITTRAWLEGELRATRNAPSGSR